MCMILPALRPLLKDPMASHMDFSHFRLLSSYCIALGYIAVLYYFHAICPTLYAYVLLFPCYLRTVSAYDITLLDELSLLQPAYDTDLAYHGTDLAFATQHNQYATALACDKQYEQYSTHLAYLPMLKQHGPMSLSPRCYGPASY
eukprot:774130-Rhodomonas_salina.1